MPFSSDKQRRLFHAAKKNAELRKRKGIHARLEVATGANPIATIMLDLCGYARLDGLFDHALYGVFDLLCRSD